MKPLYSFLSFLSLGLIFIINLFIFYPALFHSFRGDHVDYILDTSYANSFFDLFNLSFSYNRTRIFDPGDHILFRPLLFILFSIERWTFGLDAFYSQLINLGLHLGILTQIWRIVRLMGYNFIIFLLILNFSILHISQEMVIWQHMGGYLLSIIFLLEAVYQYLQYLKIPTKKDKNFKNIIGLLMLSCLSHEFLGISASLAFFISHYRLRQTESSTFNPKPKWFHGNREAFLFSIPIICYLVLNLFDFICKKHLLIFDEPKVFSFHIFYFIQGFSQILSLLAKTTLFPAMTYIFLGGRPELHSLSWPALLDGLILNTIWTKFNILYLGFILGAGLLFLIHYFRGMPKNEQNTAHNISQRSISFLCSFCLIIVSMYMLLLITGRIGPRSFNYIEYSLYHTYIFNLFITLLLCVLYYKCERFINQRHTLNIMLLTSILGLSIFINGYQTFYFNTLMRYLTEPWAEFLRETDKFVNDHKHEPDFSIKILWNEFDRHSLITIRLENQRQKVNIRHHNIIFQRYLSEFQPKYFLVYTQKDKLVAFTNINNANQFVSDSLDYWKVKKETFGEAYYSWEN